MKCFLIMSLDDQLLSSIQNLSDSSTSAADIWSQLIQRFEHKSTISRYLLKSQLLNMRIKSDEKVSDFIDRIIDISQQLNTAECRVEEVDLLFVLLNGISVSDNLRTVAQMIPLMNDVTFDKACDAVRDTELQLIKTTPMTDLSLSY